MTARLIRTFRNWLSVLRSRTLESDGQVDQKERRYEPVWISSYLVNRTLEQLRSFCNGGIDREGLVYWAGVRHGRGGVVTTLVVPKASAGPGFVQTDPAENAGIILELNRAGLVLLGQAHSHPTGAGVRHSAGDDAWTFSPFEGSLSVVIPRYADGTIEEARHWGVHRFIEGQYRWINERDHGDHLRLAETEMDRRLYA